MATGTGTGTQAASPNTTTAADLLVFVRAALGDGGSAVWPDSELLGYLNEAVREYSVHVLRRGTATLTAVSGQREYALPHDLKFVVSVEYPAGRQPRNYIYPYRNMRRRRANSEGYDVAVYADATKPPELLLGFDPQPGVGLLVNYCLTHDMKLTASSVVTVPEEHHHVLLHYTLYAAARRLQQGEQAAPTSNSSLLMSQLASNTRRLELTYLNALNRVMAQQRGDSLMQVWS